MAIRMYPASRLRTIASLLIAAHALLVVLNAVHVHSSITSPLYAELTAHPEAANHAHGHGSSDCPLSLFFSNPVLPAGLAVSLHYVSYAAVLPDLPCSGDINQPRALHPQLRAPPLA